MPGMQLYYAYTFVNTCLTVGVHKSGLGPL